MNLHIWDYELYDNYGTGHFHTSYRQFYLALLT